jgi:ABC-2 type transport system ATP-binding protein
MTTGQTRLAVFAHELSKTFQRGHGEMVNALNSVSVQASEGALTALVGPDGAGKTTLIRLCAGLMIPDGGELKVLGFDVVRRPQEVQDRIGYMPQKFGLYEDLSVQENLDLYADLHGVSREERERRYPQLMQMTALERFRNRLAGQLSGGMKQKLGLACTLVRSPDLLLLDEPTVGVDPLSRRELWEIILSLVKDQGLTVLLSTSYLDEAERCTHAIVLHSGKVLAQGPPREIADKAKGRTFTATPASGRTARSLQARMLDEPDTIDAVPEAGHVRLVRSENADRSDPRKEGNLEGVKLSPTSARFEDGFMVLLRQKMDPGHGAPMKMKIGEIKVDRQLRHDREDVIVEVRDLVKKFGDFTAVDHFNFKVRRGEIFGLLGPNGAGKTTTFRMLCGLLEATSGTLRVAGVNLLSARASARQQIGYVAQKFSLYAQLSVTENLAFFASAYGLRGEQKRSRVEWAKEQFELSELARLPAGKLSGGYRQRLAMAAALLHQPEVLFLDEPTSGADPLARREFWRRITALAEQGVTVIITTHFMEEAEYCDRVVIMDSGRVLAEGPPAELRGRAEQGQTATMEDAFVAIVEQAREHHADAGRGAV